MAEEAMNIRRAARSRFTRKRNERLKSISDKRGIEVVEINCSQLTEAWAILEGKHDIYVMYLTDEETEAADVWITKLQDLFAEATESKLKYVNDVTATESRARAEANSEESIRNECAQRQRTMEQALLSNEKRHAQYLILYTVAPRIP